jgi:hypothetical protein
MRGGDMDCVRNPALISYFLGARAYAMSRVWDIDLPTNASAEEVDRWYEGLDAKMRIGLIAISVERRLKVEPGDDYWAEKIVDLLEGSGWWEDLDLACPMNLRDIVLELRGEG